MRKISHFPVSNQENSEKFHFSAANNFNLEATTEAMSLSSHGGLLLLREEEEHLSLASRLAGCIEDKGYALVCGIVEQIGKSLYQLIYEEAPVSSRPIFTNRDENQCSTWGCLMGKTKNLW